MCAPDICLPLRCFNVVLFSCTKMDSPIFFFCWTFFKFYPPKGIFYKSQPVYKGGRISLFWNKLFFEHKRMLLHFHHVETIVLRKKGEKNPTCRLTNKSAIWKSRRTDTCNDIISWLKVCSRQVVDEVALRVFVCFPETDGCSGIHGAALSTFARFNRVISHSALPACLSSSGGSLRTWDTYRSLNIIATEGRGIYEA